MMDLPDGSVLMHAGVPYDPRKAHQYYMDHRQLKGRKPGKGTYRIKSRTGGYYKVSAQQLEEQKVYAAARTANFKKNLSDLGVLLRAKQKAAHEAKVKAARPKTLAEKADAARAASKYRAKNQQHIKSKAKAKDSTKKSTSQVDTIDSLNKQIVTTKANLLNAVARQRELATAKKNG